MKITSARLFQVRLPLLRPIANSKIEMTDREGVVVQLTGDDGREGWGEASPFPGFGLESVADAQRALEIGARELLGREIESPFGFKLAVDERCPSARGALECAVLDLVARSRGATLRGLLCDPSTPAIDIVGCNALIAASELDEIAREAEAAWSSGFRTFKLKVGGFGLDQDAARVAQLRDALGPEAKIRLDANQAYEPEAALAAIERFAVHGIDYLEQPLDARALDEASTLRSKSPIRIAADESATTEASVQAVIDSGAADVIIIKPSASGGPLASLGMARFARRAGLDVVITSMLDGAIAVAAAAQVAAVLAGEGDLPACGLATSTLFERDFAVLARAVEGRLHLSPRAGLGIEVNRASVRKCIVAPSIDVSR